MDPSAEPTIVVAHDNPLLGGGLALLLHDRLGVPCCSVRADDPDAVRDCLGPRARALVLECPDPEVAARVRSAASAVPVVDVTGVVRGAKGPAVPEAGDGLVDRLRVILDG